MNPPLTLGMQDLPETEAHHLRTVLRLPAGSAIEVFDGTGCWAAATVRTVEKRRVSVEVANVFQSHVPTPRIILATAVPKGDRLDWLVEKSTELGVHELIPLRTERSSVDPRDSKLERLRQTVIAACKQCRRNDVMRIGPVTDLQQLLAMPSDGTECLLAHPTGRRFSDWIDERRRSANELHENLLVAIGPEGGWTESEVSAALAAKSAAVSLGETVLRIETAGLLLVAGLQLFRSTIAGSPR